MQLNYVGLQGNCLFGGVISGLTAVVKVQAVKGVGILEISGRDHSSNAHKTKYHCQDPGVGIVPAIRCHGARYGEHGIPN